MSRTQLLSCEHCGEDITLTVSQILTEYPNSNTMRRRLYETGWTTFEFVTKIKLECFDEPLYKFTTKIQFLIKILH